MNLTVSDANEVIFAFDLWSSAQLIYALLRRVVILRYRSRTQSLWSGRRGAKLT